MSMWLRLVPASLVVAASLQAQASRVIDDARFTLTRAGAPFGTESFKIIRRPGADGIEYVAQCTRTTEGRILRTSLSLDSSGNATSYMRTSTGANPGRLTARRAMNRLTVNEQGPQASSRDYVFAPGTVILDDDVIHPLYFVTWRDQAEVGFVELNGRVAGRSALTEVAREDVTIGNMTIPAVRYAFGSGDDKREIWVDSERRLLKVALSARQIVGTRDLPPR
jgi:hypothetical protein